jgi:nucleotide-binding universal stress UspA family protein
VEAHADLIVVGHRHHGALAEMVLGGTGHDLLRHSHCPVLLIPAPALPPARSS